jgi:cell division protein FtsW (lipid II flippase)
MTSLKKNRHWIKWVFLAVVVIAVFFLGMVLSTIIERRAESNIAQQEGKPNPRIYETHVTWLFCGPVTASQKITNRAEGIFMQSPISAVLYALMLPL